MRDALEYCKRIIDHGINVDTNEHAAVDAVTGGPRIHSTSLRREESGAVSCGRRADAELILNRRRQGQPPDIVGIALKAQHRLYKKFWRVDQRKHRHVTITAVVRELCGFVWAILMALPHTQN